MYHCKTPIYYACSPEDLVKNQENRFLGTFCNGKTFARSSNAQKRPHPNHVLF